jgi:hypothetical protein
MLENTNPDDAVIDEVVEEVTDEVVDNDDDANNAADDNAGADEPEQKPAVEPETIGMRSVRNALKAQQAANRQLREELERARSTQAVIEQPPETKPRMDDADVDYDADKYEAKMTKWLSAKQQREQEQQNEQRQFQQSIQAKRAEFESVQKTHGAELQAAQELVEAYLSHDMQNLAIKISNTPGKLVLKLGADPDALENLAKIRDPLQFAYTLGQLENQMKPTQTTKAKPAPEVIPSRGAATAPSGNFDKAMKNAEASGNYDEALRLARLARKKS